MENCSLNLFYFVLDNPNIWTEKNQTTVQYFSFVVTDGDHKQ